MNTMQFQFQDKNIYDIMYPGNSGDVAQNIVTKSLVDDATANIAEGSDFFTETERIDKSGNDNKGDIWIKTFLINTKVNGRGWSVDPNTIHKNVKSIFGKPLVLDTNPDTAKLDHPKWDTLKSVEANLAEQSKFKVGTVEKLWYDKATDSYYAGIRVTDQRAKDYISVFDQKHLPNFVSPQIVYDPRTEQPNYFKNWGFSHLSFVHKGAYGPQAVVNGVCSGDGIACYEKLRQIPAITDNAHIAAPNPAAAASASSPEQKDKKKAASASELMRSGYIFTLTGLSLPTPPNGKRKGTLA